VRGGHCHPGRACESATSGGVYARVLATGHGSRQLEGRTIGEVTTERAIQHRHVDHDGVRLHALEWAGPHRVVLCLHGITANARAFSGLAADLALRHRVVAVDFRGRGESDVPSGGYDVETHVADVAAVLDALCLDRVDLVGWSLGGKVALALAATRAERVRRLVLLDPPVSTSAAARAALRGFWARLDRSYASIEEYLETARAGASRFGGWSPAVEAYLRADVRADSEGIVRHRVPRWVPERELEAEARTPTLRYAAAVEQPTLVLRSTLPLEFDGDAVLSVTDATRLVGVLHRARIEEVTGTNHFSMLLADPVPVTSAVRRFLDAGDSG